MSSSSAGSGGDDISAAISGIVVRPMPGSATAVRWIALAISSLRLPMSPRNAPRMKSPTSPCDHGRLPSVASASSTALASRRALANRVAGSRSSAFAITCASASDVSGRYCRTSGIGCSITARNVR